MMVSAVSHSDAGQQSADEKALQYNTFFAEKFFICWHLTHGLTVSAHALGAITLG